MCDQEQPSTDRSRKSMTKVERFKDRIIMKQGQLDTITKALQIIEEKQLTDDDLDTIFRA